MVKIIWVPIWCSFEKKTKNGWLQSNANSLVHRNTLFAQTNSITQVLQYLKPLLALKNLKYNRKEMHSFDKISHTFEIEA